VAQRSIANINKLWNRNNSGIVGARRAVTIWVGVAVADGREMRAAADDQRLTGQPRVIVYSPWINKILQVSYRIVPLWTPRIVCIT
jgi:hypothetical protein